jgi:Acidobacterial duplicated orphan permease
MKRRDNFLNGLGQEIREHIEIETQQNIALGLAPDDARRAALIKFGNPTLVAEDTRAVWRHLWLDELLQDLRFGLRMLRKSPGFTIVVVLTLALGIGANTATFSLVNALLLKRLPYPHPERMGTIFTRVSGPRASDERHGLNGEQWELLRDNVPSLLSAVSSRRTSGVNFQAGRHVQYLQAARISAHYLDVLEVHPILGRNFSDAEDLPHGPKSVILNHRTWRSTFVSDSNILGQTIHLKGEPYTVIGVLADGATTPLDADVYTALQPSRDGEGDGTNFEAVTRLRDGSTWQQADAEINRVWQSRANRYELSNNPSAQVNYYSVPLQQGETAALRPQVLALMLAAAFILLIACANLAALNLERMLRRAPEVATRLALGASRWQIQKQLWVENLLLALAGGAAAIGVGNLALRGLLLLLPEHFLPVAGVHLDKRVLAFAALVSLWTALLFGMLPALAAGRFDLRSAIGSRAATGGDHLRLRQALIVGEIALTVVLLAASGLLVRTLIQLQTLPAGFDPTGVMTARASLDDARYHSPAAFRKLLNQSTLTMRQIPGVHYSAVGLSLPYERALNNGVTLSDGKEAGQQVMTALVYVTPDYFHALQIPILAGRSFTDSDGPDSQHVAIVNREFARKFFHSADPIGRFLDKDTVIVGEVENVAMVPGLDSLAPLTGEESMYIPAAQLDDVRVLSLVHVWFQPSWIVRTAAPVQDLNAQMQRALASVDPGLPFSGFYGMRDLLAKTLARQRVEVALLSTMASLALLLSAVGIFALVANIVAQKTREVGIRMALGCTIRQAMFNVGSPAVRASVLGIVLGLALCLVTLRVMSNAIFGVAVYDGATLFSVVLVLALVTLVASTVPILRVARIDPAQTLRDE